MDLVECAIAPIPTKSTTKDAIHGVQDRRPYFLIYKTYMNGLKINRISDVINRPPLRPFSVNIEARVGLCGAAKTQKFSTLM